MDNTKQPGTLAALGLGILCAGLLFASAIGDAQARGRGGAMAANSVSAANRAQMSRGSMNRASINTGNVNRGAVNTGNVNRGNVNTGNVNRGNVNTGNINTGNVNRGNINTGNINIGNDVNIDIDYDHGWSGWDGDHHHPIAAGVAIGAMAVTTAAIVGSYYYALPPSYTTVIKNGVSYHHCGSVHYQQVWQGSDVVYVVVEP